MAFPFFDRYQHPFGHTSGTSSLTLYIDLWQEGKPAPGKNPPVISPPVVIFRRIGVCAEIRTQNPVLSNTRLAKMVPLSHLHRQGIQLNRPENLNVLIYADASYGDPINSSGKSQSGAMTTVGGHA
jgi:hypothetical protein